MLQNEQFFFKSILNDSKITIKKKSNKYKYENIIYIKKVEKESTPQIIFDNFNNSLNQNLKFYCEHISRLLFKHIKKQNCLKKQAW